MIDFVPSNGPGLVIALCWAILVAVWAVSALFVKRTVERSGNMTWVLTLVVLLPLMAILRRAANLQEPLWQRSTAIGVFADLITIAGLAVAIWARATLGRNWSGRVTFKEGHELIQRGPYAYVRHPIYSGILLMALGTAVESGRSASFLFLVVMTIAFAVKWRSEERLMTSHFPEAYPEYRRRVRALIPGVW